MKLGLEQFATPNGPNSLAKRSVSVGSHFATIKLHANCVAHKKCFAAAAAAAAAEIMVSSKN